MTSFTTFTNEKNWRASFHVTRRCDMRCTYCSVPLIDAERKNEMTVRDFLIAIDNLQALGVDLIVFTGGEPLLRPDLLAEGIPHCQQAGIYPVLLTNGRLLHEQEKLQRLVMSFEEAGEFGISFSMDYLHYAWNDGIKSISDAPVMDERHKSHYGLRGLYWALENKFKDVTATVVMDDVEPEHALISAQHISNMGASVIINLVQRGDNSVLFNPRAQEEKTLRLLCTVEAIIGNKQLLLADHPDYYTMMATGYYKEWKCKDPGLVVVQPDGALSLCNAMYGHVLPQHFNILDGVSKDAYKKAWEEDLENCCPGCYLNCHVNYHLRHDF